jgi:hypothetical protein
VTDPTMAEVGTRFFETREAAEEKKKKLEFRGAY